MPRITPILRSLAEHPRLNKLLSQQVLPASFDLLGGREHWSVREAEKDGVILTRGGSPCEVIAPAVKDGNASGDSLFVPELKRNYGFVMSAVCRMKPADLASGSGEW